MAFLKNLTMCAVWALAITACGVPMEGEGEAGPVIESVAQALDCEPGDTPNSICNLGQSCSYTRTRSAMNTCPSSSHDTTIVEVRGVPNQRYRFAASTRFANEVVFTCAASDPVLAVRIQKKVGSSWVETWYDTVQGSWNGSSCVASLAHVLSSSEYSGSGDYRIRAKAIRNDGSLETVTVTATIY